MNWTDFAVERLKGLLADGLTYTQAAKRLRCSKGAVASAVRRKIHKVPDPRKSRRARLGDPDARLRATSYSDESMTQRWAKR